MAPEINSQSTGGLKRNSLWITREHVNVKMVSQNLNSISATHLQSGLMLKIGSILNVNADIILLQDLRLNEQQSSSRKQALINGFQLSATSNSQASHTHYAKSTPIAQERLGELR